MCLLICILPVYIYIYIYIYIYTYTYSHIVPRVSSWFLISFHFFLLLVIFHICILSLCTHTHTHTHIYICAILNKSWQQHPTRHQLYGHLPPITKTIQVRRTRHAGHCWRSRDELIRDVLLWIPTHGRAKAGRPARTYIQQLCEDTGCCPEDLPRAMNDREEWRERVRDIRAASMIWWWWWYILMYTYTYIFKGIWGVKECDNTIYLIHECGKQVDMCIYLFVCVYVYVVRLCLVLV